MEMLQMSGGDQAFIPKVQEYHKEIEFLYETAIKVEPTCKFKF